MGLFDKLKETAEGAFEDVKDKVSDATGVDVDGTIDAAGTALEGADSAFEAVESFGEAKDKLAEI